MVGLVAEAICGHPCAVQCAAAAGRVAGRGFTHELHTNVDSIAISETGGVGVKPSRTSILAVVAVVTEQHNLIGSQVVQQPLLAFVTGQDDVFTS